MNSQLHSEILNKFVCAKSNHNTKFEKWWIAHEFINNRFYSKYKTYSSADVICLNNVLNELSNTPYDNEAIIKLFQQSNKEYKLVL
jgi:hypothetical protein